MTKGNYMVIMTGVKGIYVRFKFVLMKRSTLHLNSEVKEQSSRIWERVSTCSWQREQ